MSTLDETLDRLRARLQHRADGLGDRKYTMWESGVHTGHLNALHQISPHCAKTVEDAKEWFVIGMAYLDDWDSRHPLQTSDAQ